MLRNNSRSMHSTGHSTIHVRATHAQRAAGPVVKILTQEKAVSCLLNLLRRIVCWQVVYCFLVRVGHESKFDVGAATISPLIDGCQICQRQLCLKDSTACRQHGAPAETVAECRWFAVFSRTSSLRHTPSRYVRANLHLLSGTAKDAQARQV